MKYRTITIIRPSPQKGEKEKESNNPRIINSQQKLGQLREPFSPIPIRLLGNHRKSWKP